MVQFRVLSGSMAGAEVTARHFPFRVGRAASVDLRLEAPGVWQHHFELHCRYPEGFEVVCQPEVLTNLNGRRVQSAILSNGDVIELGGVKLQFWLSPTRQPSLGLREWFVWLGLATLVLFQLGVIRGLLD
jgi:pSer/pThr/pTyr-binding forkhead associated (FHA) protein